MIQAREENISVEKHLILILQWGETDHIDFNCCEKISKLIELTPVFLDIGTLVEVAMLPLKIESVLACVCKCPTGFSDRPGIETE